MNYLRQPKLSRRVCYGRNPHPSEFPPPSPRLPREDPLAANLLAQHCQLTLSLRSSPPRAAVNASATLPKPQDHTMPRDPVDPLNQGNSLHIRHDPLNNGTRSFRAPQCPLRHQPALAQQRRIGSALEAAVRTKAPLVLDPLGRVAHIDPSAGQALVQHELFASKSLPLRRHVLAHGLIAHRPLYP